MEKPKRGEVYVHFKGRLYQVERIVHHTETGEVFVSYIPLGASDDDEGWVRPLRSWNEPAVPDSEPIPRFRKSSD